MTIRNKTWALALISCLAAAPAMAGDSDTAYVFVSGGLGDAYKACSSPAIPSSQACSERNYLFRAGFGYQYTSIWALEASYGQFGYANGSGTSTFAAPVGTGQYTWTLGARGLAVQAVATVHLADTFAVIGKAGLARVEFDESLAVNNTAGQTNIPSVQTNRNTVAVAGGVQYDLSAHGSLRLLAESYGSHDIYRVYGSNTKVRLVAATASLVWFY